MQTTVTLSLGAMVLAAIGLVMLGISGRWLAAKLEAQLRSQLDAAKRIAAMVRPQHR